MNRLPIALTAALAAAAAFAADDEPARDCAYCPFESGSRGEVEAGIGYVLDDSFKYGDYTGLDEAGLFVIGNATWRYDDEDAAYGELSASDLGLDSRSIEIKAGRQGSYRAHLGYRELPKLRSRETVTPFLGAGSGTLVLPGGWTTASTTGGMSDLAASLHGTEIRHDRRRLDLGAAFLPSSRWEYTADYRHETKTGLDRAGGAFVIHSALLPEALDYTTDQFDVSARYAAEAGQLQLAYYGSLFRNANTALRWQNPYTPLAAGADTGQMAQPPDNQFHQVALAGSLQPEPRAHVSGRIAFGRALQDEPFLPATVNPNLAVALPRNSLDGRVDTIDAAARAVFRLTRRLRLKADYVYDDRDNRTPQDSFAQVTTDTFSDAPRTNLPYSFTRSAIRAGADMRLPATVRLDGGFESDNRERGDQAVARTEERTWWGRLRARPVEFSDLALSLSHSQRNGSGYTAVPEIQPPPNPLQRIPYLADRDRTRVGVRADAFPKPTLAVSLSADFAEDDYRNSAIGLQQGTDLNVTADASATLAERLTAQVFVSRGVVQWEQAGSQAFAAPDWMASSRDITDSAGLGVEKRSLLANLDVALRYTWMESQGEVEVDPGGAVPPFPDFDSRRHRVDLSGTYRMSPALSLRVGYGYERYRSSDWQLDGVMPATVANVLGLGEMSPRYGVHLVGLSATYRFGSAGGIDRRQ